MPDKDGLVRDASGDDPFALIAPTPRGDVVHAVNAVAASNAIAPGQRATDVMAIHRDLRTAYADPAAEALALDRLAAWMRRWSPHTRGDGADGVALDVTGCAHLFGGEAAMLTAMRERLAELGVTARLAMAPSHAAAHALARHAADDPVVDEDGVTDALAELPAAALRLDPSTVLLLGRLGLKRIGQLAAVPRPALKKRFGARRRRDPRDETWEDYLGRVTDRSNDVLARLDEALGRVPMPLDPTREVEPARVLRALTEPVMEMGAAMECVRPLMAELMALLEARGEGARTIALEAFRVDGARLSTRLRLSRASRDASHIMRLLADRIGDWRAEFGVDALAVEAVETAALAPSQEDGLEGGANPPPDPHALIDRLRARLGAGAVLRAVPHASHWPERAEAWVVGQDREADARHGGDAPPKDSARRGSNARHPRDVRMGRVKSLHAGPGSPVSWTDAGPPPPALPRPERLLDRPEEIAVIHAVPDGPPARFTWRRVSHDVARAAGPERIAPEWWRERGGVRSRDYWRVETNEGRRLWLYREGFEGDEREGTPRWFCHGLFS